MSVYASSLCLLLPLENCSTHFCEFTCSKLVSVILFQEHFRPKHEIVAAPTRDPKPRFGDFVITLNVSSSLYYTTHYTSWLENNFHLPSHNLFVIENILMWIMAMNFTTYAPLSNVQNLSKRRGTAFPKEGKTYQSNSYQFNSNT